MALQRQTHLCGISYSNYSNVPLPADGNDNNNNNNDNIPNPSRTQIYQSSSIRALALSTFSKLQAVAPPPWFYMTRQAAVDVEEAGFLHPEQLQYEDQVRNVVVVAVMVKPQLIPRNAVINQLTGIRAVRPTSKQRHVLQY